MGGADNVVHLLAADAKLFGIIKRKRRDEAPLPLDFIPNLLTSMAIPELVRASVV
jgi:hypothetical protein